MAVTLRDVAEAAGVSQAAVSRTLRGNGDSRFSAATRRRIHDAAQKLGYRPSFAARVLATGRTHVVGLWAYHPYEAIAVPVMRHMDCQAHEHGYGMVVSDIATRGSMEFDPAAAPVACDGLLALDCGPFAETIARVRPSEHTPVVSLGTNVLAGTDAVPSIAGARRFAATEHLIGQGCRRIVYLSGDMGRFANLPMTFVRPRDAYIGVMSEAGLAADFPQRSKIRGTSTALDPRSSNTFGKSLPGHDSLPQRRHGHWGLQLRPRTGSGLEVGRDLLLIGCDGQEDTEYFPCPISTIVFPIAEMCRTAWEFLQARLNGGRGELQDVTLEARLEVRQSALRSGKDKGGEQGAMSRERGTWDATRFVLRPCIIGCDLCW